MHATTHLKILILSIPLLCGLSAADSFAADDSFEKRISVSEPFLLDVDTGSGSIQIRSGTADQVTVIGDIKVRRRFLFGKPANAEELVQKVKNNPPVEMVDGRLRVGNFHDWNLQRNINISYEIVVPAETEVVAEAGSGSISVVDIAAPIDAHTGSGSVTLRNIAGPVKARSGSGSIRGENIGGAFKGKAGSGNIYFSQTAPGDIVVSTGSGNSELNGVVGSVDARAGSGRITIDGRQDGDWKLHSGSGTIRVSLPAEAAFNLDAETGSGGIDIDHPLTIEGRVTRKHLIGEVRGGGPLLQIDTGSGGIRIR